MKTQALKKDLAKAGFILAIIVVTAINLNAQKAINHLHFYEALFANESEGKVEASGVTAIAELDIYTGSLDFVIEETMEIENWMTTTAGWELDENVEEMEIPLEDWMTDISAYHVEEKEIEIEEWMYSIDSWK